MFQVWSGLKLRVRLIALIAWTSSLYGLARWSQGFESGPALCPLRFVTGVPCPFCGTTRSVGNLIQGDFQAALAFNPLGYLLAALALALFLIPREVKQWSEKGSIKFRNLSITQRTATVIAIMAIAWIANIPRMF